MRGFSPALARDSFPIIDMQRDEACLVQKQSALYHAGSNKQGTGFSGGGSLPISHGWCGEHASMALEYLDKTPRSETCLACPSLEYNSQGLYASAT